MLGDNLLLEDGDSRDPRHHDGRAVERHLMASDRLFDERARRIVLDICHVFPEVLGDLGRRRRELADPQLAKGR
jgi:hypothetical protein